MNKNNTTTTTLRALIGATLGFGLMFAASSPAHASETAMKVGPERVTAVSMAAYNESKIVRERTDGKKAVTFSAMQEEIDKAAEVVFEIRSESKVAEIPRWRCVARSNVRECFDTPVRVKYLEGDERMVMHVRVQASGTQAPVFANR